MAGSEDEGSALGGAEDLAPMTASTTQWAEVIAPQGVLLRRISVEADASGVHRVHADPRVYEHDPDETHRDLDHTRAFLAPFRAHWDAHGFGYWTVLVPESWWPSGSAGYLAGDGGRRMAGLGGVQGFGLLGTPVLNVHFRLAPQVQGRGLGTLVLEASLACAAAVMEQISIRNLPPGTKAALRARAQQRHRSVEAEARELLTRGIEGEPVTIVDLLGTDEGADIDFEPERLGVTARSAHL